MQVHNPHPPDDRIIIIIFFESSSSSLLIPKYNMETDVKHVPSRCKEEDSNTSVDVWWWYDVLTDGMVICHLPYGPTAYFQLLNTVMRHDIPDMGKMSEAYPHLIFHNFKTQLGQRVTHILKHLFPVPKEDSKRVITFGNENDFISFRHHTYSKSDGKNIELVEVGPRFEMRLYEIKLGTLENSNASDSEWVLRPYINTAKKKLYL